MKMPVSLVGFLLIAVSISAQTQPQSHMRRAIVQNGSFMQGGMNHQIATGVLLDQKIDSSAHTITIRVGPMNLPAKTSHMKMPQPPDLLWTIPLTGWILSYHPRLVDASGNTVPGTVLHHVAFWNENRSDFLCPGKEEHIFGAGGELTDWASVPGFGYRVQKNDRIRVETMIHNPTPVPYSKTYLEIVVHYLDDAAPAPVKNFYPAWMDVAACGNSGYDLSAGRSEKSGIIPVKSDGVLLGVGGHMHDYAKQIVLENLTHKETIATLQAKTDDKGHLQYMPVVTFYAVGGQRLSAGDKLKVTATYDNPTGKLLRQGAMGIVVGYFVPANDAEFAQFRHAAKAPEHNMHDMKDMPNMSHDQ